MTTKKHIIITQVSSPESIKNFEYEMNESNFFRPLMYDGCINGNDEVGDNFAWKYGDWLYVTKVLNILGPETKRVHWSGSSSLQGPSRFEFSPCLGGGFWRGRRRALPPQPGKGYQLFG